MGNFVEEHERKMVAFLIGPHLKIFTTTGIMIGEILDVARKRLGLPATATFWYNDARLSGTESLTQLGIRGGDTITMRF